MNMSRTQLNFDTSVGADVDIYLSSVNDSINSIVNADVLCKRALVARSTLDKLK